MPGIFANYLSEDTQADYARYAPIAGYIHRPSWVQLEPKSGQYQWQDIDRIIAIWAKENKKIAINVYPAGRGSASKPELATPQWVFDSGAKYVESFNNKITPVHWDEKYLSLYSRFIQALGQRYNGHPNIEYVSIGFGDYNECIIDLQIPPSKQLTPKYYELLNKWTAVNYSPENYKRAVYRIIDTYRNAFSNTPLALFFTNPGFKDAYPLIEDFAAYAVSNGVGIGYLGFPALLDFNPLIKQIFERYRYQLVPRIFEDGWNPKPELRQQYHSVTGVPYEQQFALADSYRTTILHKYPEDLNLTVDFTKKSREMFHMTDTDVRKKFETWNNSAWKNSFIATNQQGEYIDTKTITVSKKDDGILVSPFLTTVSQFPLKKIQGFESLTEEQIAQQLLGVSRTELKTWRFISESI